ncbi:HpcH/HpaI aldolase/citrate lyase family protein [Clostridioides sp. ES-S-0005-03]|uniref:HpcH/HpaI aldolase/citrate lyase family protein n=1 Tax=Clostridioides sp. ES-S-0005-03 TaxID=2770774 RepID=UPI001D0F8197|nr:HpcH/HpaI aldolase/citrate lyase family protein [Clostridioides sp. ES-S-0005-03]UDN49044.1 HpcH/HpaI aldolase/citrate lyase family protein [Clostridioides sp. ES-S-0173-01]
MKYFDYICKEDLEKIFLKVPEDFNANTEKDVLKYALGAFLYVPATQYNMIYKSIIGDVKGVRPLAICLEDAVGANGESEAIENLKLILKNISNENITNKDGIPLIFVRIKDVEQLLRIKEIIIKNNNTITGILIPKANSELIENCIEVLNSIGLQNMYVIPIIETREFIYKENKELSFSSLYNTILRYKSRILSIRIGLTDILGMYGIRRNKNFFIYNNLICSSFILDIITYLQRPEIDIPISGGVSEFFDMTNEEIRNKYIEEILLDKFHGLVGKTVIHPMQIQIVQALSAVSYEDFTDALEILDSTNSKYGVSKGILGERMNETNPHFLWAKKTLILSKIYGVLNKGVDYEELLKF